MSQLSYKEAGVDIERAEESTARIKQYAAATHNNQVLKSVGLFSGFFELPLSNYRQPVLVSSIDGVGTKVRVAEMAGAYETLGHDIVNHCINDIAVCGADPLFFLDYFAADRLDGAILESIIKGMSISCQQAGCALVGGETAEMPGVYAPRSYDLAGAIVGAVEKSAIIDGLNIRAGDRLLGLPSDGLHTNGYSLARKVLFEKKQYAVSEYIAELGSTLAEALLRPHKSYLKTIRNIRKLAGVKGIAHITGGGIVANTQRLLADELALAIDWDAWQQSAIFDLIQREGDISTEEMRRVFNLGIGLVLVVAEDGLDEVMSGCEERVVPIGSVVRKTKE